MVIVVVQGPDARVAVEVGEGVAEAVGVGVDVAVGVKVCEGVAEAVGVDVNVTTPVKVDVGVDVGVTTPVEVEVGVGDAITEVEVGAGLEFGVDEGGGGKYTNVFVGLAKAVFVANAVVVAGVTVRVVTNVSDVGVVKDVSAVVRSGVTVESEAPGVRKSLIQAGFVRMAASTGSMNPSGLRVRKSRFGSILDSTLVSSSQSGVKRRAQPPASRIHRSPNNRIRAITAQSRFSFSVALMGKSIERQSDMNRGTRTQLFIVPGAFDPDPSVMGVYDTARDGQSQPWPAAFELGLAG